MNGNAPSYYRVCAFTDSSKGTMAIAVTAIITVTLPATMLMDTCKCSPMMRVELPFVLAAHGFRWSNSHASY